MYFRHAPCNLVEFAYESVAVQELTTAALIRLARQAWSFNARSGITGVLRFADGTFQQVIEGPCEVILPLASRILSDRRHGAIKIDAFQPISARQHSGLRMTGFWPAEVEVSTDCVVASNLHHFPGTVLLGGTARGREPSAATAP